MPDHAADHTADNAADNAQGPSSEPTPGGRGTVGEVQPRRRDRLAVFLCFALWLVPLAWQGFVRRPMPGLVSPLRRLTNISCLFSHALPTWTLFYTQVRIRAGGPWTTLDPEPGFALEPFGHRTRLHRFLVQWRGSRPRGLDELAQYLLDAYARAHPRAPAVELRFLQAPQEIGREAVPRGAWKRPLLRDIPANHLHIVSTHTWNETR
jgi:hypothetical protein